MASLAHYFCGCQSVVLGIPSSLSINKKDANLGKKKMSNFFYTAFNDKTNKVTSEDVENDLSILQHFIYCSDPSGKVRRLKIFEAYEFLDEDYTMYEHVEGKFRPLNIPANMIKDVLPDTWAMRMLADYMRRHPEQTLWANAAIVENLSMRDELLKQRRIEPEHWVYVRNSGEGVSKEYVLSFEKDFWIDTGINGESIPSGLWMLMELYNRLKSGYLFDTFGPNGQNRTVCDFVLAFYMRHDVGRTVAAPWNKTGDELRWDFGNDTVLTGTGFPAVTLTNTVIATCSAEDTLEGMDIYFSDRSFHGTIPRVDASASTVNNFYPSYTSGALPPIDTSSRTSSAVRFLTFNSRATSLPDLDLRNCSNVIDFALEAVSLQKIGKIQLSSENLQIYGMFRSSGVNSKYYKNVTIEGNLANVNGTGDIFSNSYRPEPINITNDLFGFPLEQTGNMLTRGSNIGNLDISLSNCTTLDTFFQSSNIINGKVRGLENIIIDGEGDLNMFSNVTVSNNTILETYIKELYDNRFVHKQNSVLDEGRRVLINLTTRDLARPLSGRYVNSSTPATAMEYLYKLVENPDDEDILNYYALINNSDSNLSNDITFRFDSSNETISFSYFHRNRPLHSHKVNHKLKVDWGDGTIDEIILTRERITNSLYSDFSHTYNMPGTYTVQFFGFDSPFVYDGLLRASSSSLPRDKIIGVNFTNVYYMVDWPYNMDNIEEVRFKTPAAITAFWARNVGRNCPKLKHIDPLAFFFEPGGNSSNILQGSNALESVQLINYQRSINISNRQFSAEALNKFFDALGTVPSGDETVTVTGNPGVGQDGYDPTIATNKGWLVVDGT